MRTLTLGSFCSGVLGLDRGIAAAFAVAGLPLVPIWHCEKDEGASIVLKARHPDVHNYGDLLKTDWSVPEPPDVLALGFPCQPFSAAGMQKGTDDERHLFPAIVEAIQAMRRLPSYIVIENVPRIVTIQKGEVWRYVISELERLGYLGAWTIESAGDVGAPHLRKRVFLVARLAWLKEKPVIRRVDRGSAGVAAELLPSPMARDSKGVNIEGTREGTPGLPHIIVNLPTPRTTDAKGPKRNGDDGPSLNTVVAELMPTPAATYAAYQSAGYGLNLHEAVARFPTPAARLGDKRGHPSVETAQARMDSGRRNLEDAVALLPSPMAARSGRNLSPWPNSEVRPSLDQVGKLFPTPRASDTGTDGRRASEGYRPPLSQVVRELTDDEREAERAWWLHHDVEEARAAADDNAWLPPFAAAAPADRWGKYGQAIARWEAVWGEPAPAPRIAKQRGEGERLNPAFPEWMMGWPAGWVTDPALGLSYGQQLRCIGNGVVSRQAAVTCSFLLSVL